MSGNPGGRGEIYIEFLRQGAFVKATAIDAGSGVEVSLVGPANAPEAALKAALLRKLDYLSRKRPGGA